MSATNRSKVRRPNDFYSTPISPIHRLLDEVKLPGGHWLEPSAGTGALIQGVNSHNTVTPTWDACELSFWAYQALKPLSNNLIIGDFLKTDFEVGKYSVIITNPPYSKATEFIKKGLSLKPQVLVYLLRLNFLGSQKRCSFLRKHTPDIWVLSERPGFTNNGKTDATEYAWFCFYPYERDVGQIRVLNTSK
jgi:hypothetical protein